MLWLNNVMTSARLQADPAWEVAGDFKVEVYLDRPGKRGAQRLFWAWHNSAFMSGTSCTLGRDALDKVAAAVPAGVEAALAWTHVDDDSPVFEAVAEPCMPVSPFAETPFAAAAVTLPPARRASAANPAALLSAPAAMPARERGPWSVPEFPAILPARARELGADADAPANGLCWRMPRRERQSLVRMGWM